MTETSERRPWTVQSILDQLEGLGALDVQEIHRAMHPEGERLAAALRNSLHDLSGKAKLGAAMLLLLLKDKNGRDPFLEALAGPDDDIRSLAIECLQYCVCPSDIESRDSVRTTCPVSSDELFEVLKRDLHEPWAGQNRRILELVAWHDWPQSRSITRPLLTHPDASLRRTIAESYLRAGRDEGAFAVVEDFLRSAPAHVPHRDPRWHDFYDVKGLWLSLEEVAQHGDIELRAKAASLAMALVIEALDAPDVEKRFDFNDGLISASSAVKVLEAVMPSGTKGLLERIISCDAVGEYYRGQALMAYARALGHEASHFVLSQLRNHDLRKYAAQAIEPLVKDQNDPYHVAELSDALANEVRPDVVAAVATALLAAGPAGQTPVEAALDRSEPWTKVELSWRLSGGTDREFADLLTASGVMDPISDTQLAEALSSGFDVRSLIWAGGQRLVIFNVKATTGLEHYKLFQELLRAARPVIAVDDLKETCNANLLREPVERMPSVEKITDLGTECTISFRYQGQGFRFPARPQGRWHDVAAVMKGCDAFMQTIGRDDRCYELEGGGDMVMLIVAPASRFEPVAARLGIPLERDSATARDAAKAYQRRIQEL